jgi:hypothetical protein
VSENVAGAPTIGTGQVDFSGPDGKRRSVAFAEKCHADIFHDLITSRGRLPGVHVALGDRVVVDDDPTMIAKVTAIQYRSVGLAEVEISWAVHGDLKTAWVADGRLSLLLSDEEVR